MTTFSDSVYLTIVHRKPQYVEEVKRLLEEGISPKEHDHEGTTALHLAVEDPEFSKELTELLVNSGANVNAKNCDNDTPLHCALRNDQDNTAAIKLLLQSSADVNARNGAGETPLLLATENTFCGLNILKELLQHGANDFSNSLLKAAANTSILNEEYHSTGNVKLTSSNEKLKMLLDFGGRVDTCDYWGNTLLQIAAMQPKPNVETIKLLVERGLRINAVDSTGKTILHLLIAYSVINKDIFSTVLELNARINAQDNMLLTPLHLLLLHWHPSLMHVFDLMIAKGANPNLKTSEGCNALHIASTSFAPSFCNTSDPSLTHIVRVLVSHGADVNSKNNEALTPLALAVQHDHLNVFAIRELIRSGANVNCTIGEPPAPIIHYVATKVASMTVDDDLIWEEKIDDYMTVLHLLFEHGATLMGSQSCCINTLNRVLRKCLKFGEIEMVHKMWYDIMNMLLNNGAFLVINQSSREHVFKNMISGVRWDFTFEKERLELSKLFIKFFVLHSNDRKANGILFKLLTFEPRLMLYANKCIAEIKLMDDHFFSYTKPMFKKYYNKTRRGKSFQSLLLHLLCGKVKGKCYFELIEFLYVHYDELEIFGSLLMSKFNVKRLQEFVLAERMLLPVPRFIEGCTEKAPSHSFTKLPENIVAHVVGLLSVEDIGNYMLAFRSVRKGRLMNVRNSKRKFEETEENLDRPKFWKRQRTF